MADVTTTFAAKDESFAKTVDRLEKRLGGFQSTVSGFTGKVGAMAKSFKSLIGPVAALGAAFLGARSAAQSFSAAISLGGQLNDLAARTGATAGELMVLQRAFQNAGAGADKVGPTINKLQKQIIEAGQGSKVAADAFDMLGLSAQALERMTPTEQIRAVAEAITRLPDPAQRSAVAMQLLGRSGGELLPFLRNFNGEMDTATQQLGSAPRLMDEMNVALDSIGDNFAAISSKGMEFALGLLKNVAPVLADITDWISKIDFAGMGESLGDAIQRAYDFMVGLFADPSAIFGLYGSYLDATFRAAGDSLITAFTTAGDFLSNLFQQFASQDTFGTLGEMLADLFVYSANVLQLKLIEGIELSLQLFDKLWKAVTSGGVSFFTDLLADMIFEFTAGLMGTAKKSAEAYDQAWDSATGSILQKHKAGLQASVQASGDELAQSGAAFGNSLSRAVGNAVSGTEVVRSNFFGSAEAMANLSQQVSDIANKGEQLRKSGESYAESVQSAADAANATTSEINSQMDKAAGKPQGSAATPSGQVINAADAQEIQRSYNEQAQEIRESSESAGEFKERMDALNRWMTETLAQNRSIETGAENAARPVANATAPTQDTERARSPVQETNAAREVATETTLQKVARIMEELNTKLPQPILV